jgi:hypothetical protein
VRGFDVFPASFLASLTLLIGGTAFLLGQQPETPARLLGCVVDRGDGKPVSGAHVIVEHHGRRAADAASDARGQFLIEQLPAGYYQITVTHAGHTPARRGVQLVAGRDQELEARLVSCSANGP